MLLERRSRSPLGVVAWNRKLGTGNRDTLERELTWLDGRGGGGGGEKSSRGNIRCGKMGNCFPAYLALISS